MENQGYEIDVIVQGYPGKTVCHGGLGWSTIVLLRGHGRIALIDCGGIGVRKVLIQQLKQRGVSPKDVTDLLLTHAHYDHILNWTLFSHSRIAIGEGEIEWAVKEPWGETAVPELYVRELDTWPTARFLSDGEEVLPNITAHIAAGHTPGHLIFVLKGSDHDIIFTGDAAKNRAELLCGRTDMTYDAAVSAATVDAIWSRWRSRPGNLLIPGHDLPMKLVAGKPEYIGERTAVIEAWFGDTVETTTAIQLSLK